MIKSVSLLTRKAGLSHEEFVKHWLEGHAPLEAQGAVASFGRINGRARF